MDDWSIEKRLRNLVISGHGVKISRAGKVLLIEKGDAKERVSPKGLEQLIVFGNCSVTSEAIRYLSREGVDIVFVDERHTQYLRVVEANRNPMRECWLDQLRIGEGEQLELAKEFVASALYNRGRLLLQFESTKDKGREVMDTGARSAEASTLQELWGFEGEGTKLYFSSWKGIIPSDFSFNRRAKNPPPDPINSLLGYGYTVLKSIVEYALLRSGLNPYIGLLHRSYRDRPALAFDLMEPFRPVLVDRVVLTLIRRGSLRPSDFVSPSPGVVHIAGEGKRVYLERLYARMEDTHRYRGEAIEFLDILFMQAKELRDAIAGKREFRAFRWR